jgi:hypothetical protein
MSAPLEVCDSTDQTAHCHILGLAHRVSTDLPYCTSTQTDVDAQACSTHRGNETCMYNFVRELEEKRLLRKRSCRREDKKVTLVGVSGLENRN